jgi:N-acetyl-gamma-glutamyl-phosphate reductase
MTARIFIDGQVGTTGLRIRDWLVGRDDLELLEIDEARRKQPAARRECLEAADLAVLCLPDDAALEAAGWLRDASTRILDASTAHRVAADWVYGLPELEASQRAAIRAAKRVSNPGCYASATILALRPLIDAGLVAAATPITAHALSGYTGGGRAKIERWRDPEVGLTALPYEAPYSLDARHKHMPELTLHCGLDREPHFVPAVGPFACGMRVELPLHAGLLEAGSSAKSIWEALHERYRGERFVAVKPMLKARADDEFALDPRACNDTNRIDLHVIGHESGHVLLVAILDNLGKGAAGVAIQNLNQMLGLPEERGLRSCCAGPSASC